MSLSSTLPTSGSSKTRGAERLLVITELKLVGTSLQPTGVEFKFSREDFSAPRGPWNFGVELRTVRQDLPGVEEPVEQVLGWHYTPFTMSGIWHDKHAGQGYAEQTRRNFEELVKRGNPVQIQFEQVAFTGLIKVANFSYIRQDKQGYSFTVSPHFKHKGETVRVDPNPRALLDPATSVAKSRAAFDLLKADQALAQIRSNARVQQLLKSSIFSDIGAGLDTIETSITSAEQTVSKEILVAENATNALKRGAQIMGSIKTQVSALLNQTRSLSAGAQMSVASLTETLNFETWQRGINGNARALVVFTDESRKDFAYRAEPQPQRLHRVRQGESLYQISTRYYGTPHHWRDIMLTNKLSSIVLQGGELLIIPTLKL